MKKPSGALAILVDRKSRFVKKDAAAVLNKAEKIQSVAPDIRVVLETTAPVCSKSRKWLEERGIPVIEK